MADSVIYLDNNATTQVAPEVIESMIPFFSHQYGNPSSIHRFGGKVKKSIDTAREQVAALLNAKPSEIYFTASGSEGDNWALQGFCLHNGISQSTLITSKVEHSAIRNCCKALHRRGAGLHEVDVDSQGSLDIDFINRVHCSSHTLASLMWANNETGVLFPISKIAEQIKDRGGFIHTDAVQAVGKIPIDVKSVPIDMLVLSGHKLHAPKGIGVLYIREGVRISPLIYGGHHEQGLRAGTENVAYIVGLGVACELAMKRIEKEATEVKKLRDKLEKELLQRCKGGKLNGHPDFRLPNTTNISFEFIEGEAILLMLDEKNIAASSGSACTTGSLEPSHVMMAMGIPYTFAHSSIRFSLSTYTTESEIDAVIGCMPSIVESLREISPYVK